MHKHLFFDSEQFEDVKNFTQVMNPPRKHGAPVLSTDRPWEQVNKTQISLYGTVLYNAGNFHMWYQIYWLPVPFDNKKQRLVYGYAASPDGVTWQKPILKLNEYMGSKENNVVAGDDAHWCHGATVIVDPHEVDADKRFKLIALPGYLAFSPDGIRWRRAPREQTNVGDFTYDTHHVFFWDERFGEYRMYCRPGNGDRRVALATSRDCMTWEWHKPRNVLLEPDERDMKACNIKGFYNMSVIPYRGLYIGLLAAYYRDETVDIQLTWSPDGITWHRCADRRPFIPRGPRGSIDSGMLYPASDIVRVGNDIRIYYSAHNYLHLVQDIQRPDAAPCITFATLRDDGFVSFDAGDAEGSFATKPLPISGGRLLVNTSASNGYVTVEVRDEQGKPIPGFSAQEANPVTGEGVKLEARWRNDTIARLKGRTVRIGFRAKNAKIYSFWLE